MKLYNKEMIPTVLRRNFHKIILIVLLTVSALAVRISFQQENYQLSVLIVLVTMATMVMAILNLHLQESRKKLKKEIQNRKEIEDKLHNSISLLEATLNSTADGILVVGNDNKIKSYSKKFVELWNIPAELLETKDDTQVLNFVLEQLKHPDEFIEKVRYLYDHPYESCSDLIKFKDGKVFERYTQPQMVGGKVEGRVWCFIDVSEKIHSEQKLKQLNYDLKESNKEIREFLYVASHDLREPLRKITAFGSLLEASLTKKLSGDESENLDFIMEGSNRMSQIVEGLLDYSRIISKEKEIEKTDFNTIINRLTKGSLKDAVDKAQATLSIPEVLPAAMVDGAMANQLFYSIINNAIKYRSQDRHPHITITSTPAADGMVRIEVNDNGLGIKPEYQQAIFNLFKRLHTRDKYKGIGIGLTICKKIVSRHKGKIGVKSQFGKGSTFWFTVPVTIENSLPQNKTSQTAETNA